jgi:hypothetical protein
MLRKAQNFLAARKTNDTAEERIKDIAIQGD